MAKINNTKFGIRLRELREEAGVSMMQLAKAIEVSDAAICKWENGIAEPKASSIVKLAEYFDCSTDYLIGAEDDFARAPSRKAVVKTSDGATVKPTAGLSSAECELIEVYRELPPDRRKLAREAIGAWRSLPDKKAPEEP